MGLLISLFVYEMWYALPLYIIAKKSGHEYAWAAFVPFVSFWLMCDLADVSIFVVFLTLIPVLNLLVHMYLWSRIAESTNKSPAWGVLMVVPVVSILVSFYLALYEPTDTRY